MIVITGPGRSGTSVIALIYRELGFDPGGKWLAQVNAGFEAPEVVKLNNAIIEDLGIAPLIKGHRPGIRYRHPRLASFADSASLLLPQWLVEKAKAILESYDRQGQLKLARWERFEDVVSKYRTTLREVSRSNAVIKDPRFCWTLMVWAAAGAQVDYVVMCIRALDSMVRSRLAAGHLKTKSLGDAKNSLVYAMGMCFSTLYSYDIPHSILKFPDFTEKAESLYNALRFPRHVAYERFIDAFHRVVDPRKVHEQQYLTNHKNRELSGLKDS